MKRMLPFLLALFLLAGCGGNTSDGSYEQITQEEAKEMMDTQEVTYTHVTPDMQRAASDVVGGFLKNLLGEELNPWQGNEKAEPAP